VYLSKQLYSTLSPELYSFFDISVVSAKSTFGGGPHFSEGKAKVLFYFIDYFQQQENVALKLSISATLLFYGLKP